MKNFIFILLVLVSIISPLCSFGYVPPSQYMVNKLAMKHGGFKGFKIKTEVMGMEFGQSTETKFKAIHTYYSEIQMLRSKAINDSGQILYSMEKPMKMFSVLSQLQFQSDGTALAKALKEKGVPITMEEELAKIDSEEKRRAVEKTYLTRWKTTPVWAIGIKDKESAQLWIEKDTFLPIKISYSNGGNFFEIQFESYRFFREFPYPRSLQFFKDGSGPLLKEEVVEVMVNPDTNEFKNNPLSDTSGFTDAGNVLPSATRDLIRQYYEYLR